MENTYLGKDVIIMCEIIEIDESEIRIEESGFKHLTALEYFYNTEIPFEESDY